jgi:hypothetical protein
MLSSAFSHLPLKAPVRGTLRTASLVICTIAATSLAVPSAAKATILAYNAILSGAAESPPNASPGTGFAAVIIDTVLNTMQVDVIFSGLLAPNTAAHIHCCTAIPGTGTAGVATVVPTFTGFPGATTSGTYSHLFDTTLASTFNPAFVAAHTDVTTAFAFLLAGLNDGKAYLNIHSSVFPGGEIRGFLAETPIPAALPLFATGLGGLGLFAWRRKRKDARLAG